MTPGAQPQALVDTDVLIDHLRGHRRIGPAIPIAYSVVSRCELFAGTDDADVIRTLLDAMVEVDVDRRIAAVAGAIRRDHRVSMPDALVAATALNLGLPLVTRNGKHFRGVTGLSVRASIS